MTKKTTSYLLFFIWGCLLVAGCSKSDDQRKFENEALTAPKGITKTSANGDIDTTSTDPDDWRISPMYHGLISVGLGDNQPPYPNPVNYNSNLTVQLTFNVTDPVDAIEIRSFRYPNENQFPRIKFLDQNELSTFNTITIQAKNIAIGQGSSASGLYRLLIYDGNQNMITYGDIEIQ
ncbi:MAG TPA: hypothetical protein VJ964_16120 [Balneolaceae bacterium]|nr:hypothetical protein [Balneolaceae bacterium]